MNDRPLTLRTVWIAVLFGVLIATAPGWINKSPQATYDAPWVHPSVLAR